MTTKEKSIWRELEIGFGGGSKFRVLLHLAINHNEAFTRYALVKATGLRTPSVESQLKVLLDLDWVREYPFTPKTYQVNLEHKVVKGISDFFARMKYLGH